MVEINERTHTGLGLSLVAIGFALFTGGYCVVPEANLQLCGNQPARGTGFHCGLARL